MCTRLLYESGAGSLITARSMDWYEDLGSDLWFYPKGMKRDGGFGPGSVAWASTYGSVTLSGYDVGTADGMNEAGLVANLLYLAEADYAARSDDDRPRLSVDTPSVGDLSSKTQMVTSRALVVRAFRCREHQLLMFRLLTTRALRPLWSPVIWSSSR